MRQTQRIQFTRIITNLCFLRGCVCQKKKAKLQSLNRHWKKQCYVVQNIAKDGAFCEYLYVIIWPWQMGLLAFARRLKNRACHSLKTWLVFPAYPLQSPWHFVISVSARVSVLQYFHQFLRLSIAFPAFLIID